MSHSSPRCVSDAVDFTPSKLQQEDASIYDESSYYPISTRTPLVSNKASGRGNKSGGYQYTMADDSPNRRSTIKHSNHIPLVAQEEADEFSSFTSSEDLLQRQSRNDDSASVSTMDEELRKLNMTDQKLMEGRSSPGAMLLTAEGLKSHDRKTFDESMEVPVRALGNGYCSWKRRHDHRQHHRKQNKDVDWDVLQQPRRRDDIRRNAGPSLPKPNRKEMKKDISSMSLAPLETLEDVSTDLNFNTKQRWPLAKKSVCAQELLEQERERECEYRRKQQRAERQEARRIEQLRQKELARQRKLQGLSGPPPPPPPTRRTREAPVQAHTRPHHTQNRPREKKRVSFRSGPATQAPPKKSPLVDSPPVVLNSGDATCCEDGVEVVMDCLLSTAISGLSRKKVCSATNFKNCVVCTVQERTHMALPCKHFSFCQDCVWRLQQSQNFACPVCSMPNVKYSLVQEEM